MFLSFFRPSTGQRSSIRGTINATVYCGILYYLQGVDENKIITDFVKIKILLVRM